MVGALLVAGATPANAHAGLVGTDPAAGQVLDSSPRRIEVRFNEPVVASPEAIRVYDARGEPVATTDARQPRPEIVRVRLAETLPRGGYVATWRASSLDAHPVQGAFTFQVGDATRPGRLDRLATELLRGRRASTGLGVAYGVSRWVLFASLSLLLGGVFALWWILPVLRNTRRGRALTWLGWAGAVAATGFGLLTYGPYDAGGSLGDVLTGSGLDASLDQRFGQVAITRLVLLAISAPLLSALMRAAPSDRMPARWSVPAVGVGLALAATPAFAGHPSSGDLSDLAIVTDMLHVAAMAIWVGGLAALTTTLLPPRLVDGPSLRTAMRRFSTVAAACVGVLLVTGGFQAWRQVRSFELLRTTEYGRLLTVKLALVAGALVLAARNRRAVQMLPGHGSGADAANHPSGPAVGDDPPADPAGPAATHSVRALPRFVTAELLVLVLVLVATALLVNAPPARTAGTSAEQGLVALNLQSRRLWMDVTIAPARVGSNEMHLTALTPGGTLNDIEDMSATLDLPERRIGPLDLTLRRLTAGHYVVDVVIPTPGRWRLTTRTRISDTDVVTLTGRFDIP